MMRNARQAKIVEIITANEIETQEELCAALAASGYSVTQATVSRDIKELRLFKVKGTGKRFRYASAKENEDGISDKMRSLFQTCVEDIRPVGNLIGDKEMEEGTVSVRRRGEGDIGSMPKADFFALVQKENAEKTVF